MSRTAIRIAGVGVLLVAIAAGSALAGGALSNPPAPEGTLTVGSMGQGYDGAAYQYRDGEEIWRYGADAISVNAVSRLDDGGLLLTYQSKDGESVRTGVRIIDRETKRTRWEWSMPVETALNSEIHDAELLPSGDVLIADMDRERILIVDRETKRVRWEWQASAHYQPPAEGPTSRDWLHINDVDRIGDGRYLVSVRNANQLLVVERGVGVVEVVNRDRTDANDQNCRGARDNQLVGADIRCGDPSVLNHQHNPHWLGDGAVLVADSENDRIVELHRDEGGWRPTWTIHRAAGIGLDWPRDADRLPDGTTVITDTGNARVVGIAPNGSTLWSQEVARQPYEADLSGDGESVPVTWTFAGGGQGRTVPEVPIETASVWHGVVRYLVPLPRGWGEWQTVIATFGVVFVLLGGAVGLHDRVRGISGDPSPDEEVVGGD